MLKRFSHLLVICYTREDIVDDKMSPIYIYIFFYTYLPNNTFIIAVVFEIHDDLFQVRFIGAKLELNRERYGDTIFVEALDTWKFRGLVNTREYDKFETRWTGM